MKGNLGARSELEMGLLEYNAGLFIYFFRLEGLRLSVAVRVTFLYNRRVGGCMPDRRDYKMCDLLETMLGGCKT